jgi:hypothetical protein
MNIQNGLNYLRLCMHFSAVGKCTSHGVATDDTNAVIIQQQRTYILPLHLLAPDFSVSNKGDTEQARLTVTDLGYVQAAPACVPAASKYYLHR